MPSAADDYIVYFTLVLAAAAAIMSAPAQSGETSQKLQWLLVTSAAVEASVMAGAIGEDPDAMLPPEFEKSTSAARIAFGGR
jgi:hypothetical protein